MGTIEDIDLSVPGSPSVVLRDLSEYATLPFLAAFDVEVVPKSQTPPKRITYIAISKKTLPMLVRLFIKFKNQPEIYIDGTLEAVLSVSTALLLYLPPPNTHMSTGVLDTRETEI